MKLVSKSKLKMCLYNFKTQTIIFFLVINAINIQAQNKYNLNSKKPNIIYILTDDLGIGDLGVFFQNQRRLENNRNKPFTVTPYLDAMAKKGAMLNQYCAAPVCAPSRASFLSGQSQGHANVRDNQFDKALADNYTVGNVMQKVGYHTIAIGKWGLQGGGEKKSEDKNWPAHPLKRGFDKYMGYIRHGDGHEHYPKEGISRGPKEVYEGYNEISASLDKCYTGDLFTAYAKNYIIQHEKGKDKNEPFFMYLAFDTPHAVLELPTQAYPKGFGLKGGLQWTGKPGAMINTASGKPDSWFDPTYNNATYDDDSNSATPEVPWPDVYKRYATIVKRIDNQVNDILQLLENLKIADNTLVVFTSDNGPSIESYLKDEPIKANFFESFGPFDGIKRDLLEGGIRMPTLAYWPGRIAAETKMVEPSISYDWLPTFLDMANYSAPIISDGVSLLPALTGKSDKNKSQIYLEYFEKGNTPDYKEFSPSHRRKKRGQMQMLRLQDTVAIRYNIQSPEDDFEIYDILKDPKQENDLSKTENLKAMQKFLKAKVLQSRLADSSAKRPYDGAIIPGKGITSSLKKGWKMTNYEVNTDWISAPAIESVQIINSLDFKGEKNSYLFSGYVNIPEDGHYTFSLKTEGKAFIRLHDIALIDEDSNYKSGTLKSQTLHLAKGFHPIKLYSKSNGAKPKVQFQLNKQGEAQKDISEFVFSAF